MSSVYLTEYAQPATFGGVVPVANCPEIQSQKLTTSGSSQQLTFATNTHLIRIHTDGIISIKIGTNPTATTSTGRMVAGQTEYFGVVPSDKLAVIDNT